MKLYAHAGHSETLGNLADDLWRFECVLIQIEHYFAACADEVVMRLRGGVHANGTVMKAQFTEHTALYKRVKRFINGCEGNTGNQLADNLVNLFRTWVTGRGHERVVYNGALMRHGKAVQAAEFSEVSLSAELHLNSWMRRKA